MSCVINIDISHIWLHSLKYIQCNLKTIAMELASSLWRITAHFFQQLEVVGYSCLPLICIPFNITNRSLCYYNHFYAYNFFMDHSDSVIKNINKVLVMKSCYCCKPLKAKRNFSRGTWVAQSVEHLTLAQVMISQFVSLSPVSGSVLRAQSLKPASDSVSPSLSALPPLVLCLSKINKCKNKNKTK